MARPVKRPSGTSAHKAPAIVAALVILAGLAGTPHSGSVALTLAPGQGVSFSQVDFTYPGATTLDSSYGMLAADFGAVSASTGMSLGFVNASTSAGWVVQNLPIDLSSDLPGLSVYFDLGTTGDVTSLPVLVDLSPVPMVTFSGTPTHSFAVAAVSRDAQGADVAPVSGPVGAPPAPAGIQFDAGGLLELTWQPGHVTLQEDDNQCAVGSIARSLTYLKNRFGLPVPHANNPGTGTENTPNSLAAELDKKFVDRTGMPPGGRAKGAGVNREQIMNGKLSYIDMFNLRVETKHHRIAAGNLPGIPAGDYTGSTGSTSRDRTSTPVIDWLLGEIRKGEDVEMLYGGGQGVTHAVTIVGGGRILNRPWVAVQDDADQGWDMASMMNGTTFLEGGLRFTFLRDTDGDGIIEATTLEKLTSPSGTSNKLGLLISESVPAPPTLLLVVVAVVAAAAAAWPHRRRRAPRASPGR